MKPRIKSALIFSTILSQFHPSVVLAQDAAQPSDATSPADEGPADPSVIENEVSGNGLNSTNDGHDDTSSPNGGDSLSSTATEAESTSDPNTATPDTTQNSPTLATNPAPVIGTTLPKSTAPTASMSNMGESADAAIAAALAQQQAAIDEANRQSDAAMKAAALALQQAAPDEANKQSDTAINNAMAAMQEAQRQAEAAILLAQQQANQAVQAAIRTTPNATASRPTTLANVTAPPTSGGYPTSVNNQIEDSLAPPPAAATPVDYGSAEQAARDAEAAIAAANAATKSAASASTPAQAAELARRAETTASNAVTTAAASAQRIAAVKTNLDAAHANAKQALIDAEKAVQDALKQADGTAATAKAALEAAKTDSDEAQAAAALAAIADEKAKKSLEEAEKSLSSVQSELTQKLDSIRKDRDSVNTDLASATKAVSDAEAAEAEAKTKFNSSITLVEQVKKEIGEAEVALKEDDEYVRNLNERAEAFDLEVAALRVKINQLNSSESPVQSELDGLNNKLSEILGEQAKAIVDLQAAKERIDAGKKALELKHEAWKKANDDVTVFLEEEQKAATLRSDATAELAKLKEKDSKLAAASSSVETDYAQKIADEKATLEARKRDAEQATMALKEALDKATAKANAAEAAAADADEQVARAKAALEAARAAAERAEGNSSSLQLTLNQVTAYLQASLKSQSLAHETLKSAETLRKAAEQRLISEQARLSEQIRLTDAVAPRVQETSRGADAPQVAVQVRQTPAAGTVDTARVGAPVQAILAAGRQAVREVAALPERQLTANILATAPVTFRNGSSGIPLLQRFGFGGLAGQVREVLARDPRAKVVIMGYADADMTPEAAALLAAERASAIRRLLQNTFNIPADNLVAATTFAEGQTMPIVMQVGINAP